MKSVDKVVRTLVEDGNISLTVIQNRNMVQTAAIKHLLSDLGMHTLGKVLTAVTYMASCLKDERGEVSVTIKGNGEGGDICVAGNYELHLRGAIDDPYVYLPLKNGEEDVAACVGHEGIMTVVRDDGYSTPFVGTCSLTTGEIEDEFAGYYARSEQTPTAFRLFVRTEHDDCVYSGGIIVQPMPGAEVEAVERVTQLLLRTDLKELMERTDAEDFIRIFYPTSELEIRYPKYQCNCSREYLRDILVSFGEGELRDIIEKEGRIAAHCHFCNTDYIFTEEDVNALFPKN